MTLAVKSIMTEIEKNFSKVFGNELDFLAVLNKVLHKRLDEQLEFVLYDLTRAARYKDLVALIKEVEDLIHEKEKAGRAANRVAKTTSSNKS